MPRNKIQSLIEGGIPNQEALNTVKERLTYSLPERFVATSNLSMGIVAVEDTETGRRTNVAIKAFEDVRSFLGAMFGVAPVETISHVPPPMVALPDLNRLPHANVDGEAIPSHTSDNFPPPNLRGIALRSWKRSRGIDHGTLSSLRSTTSQLFAKVQAPQRHPSGSLVLPSGWEQSVQGEGFSMDFAPDPETGGPAYRITVTGREVGWARLEAQGANHYLVHSLSGDLETTRHRNFNGVLSKLEAQFEKV